MDTVRELRKWLKGMKPTDHVAVDEGGLCLVVVETRNREHDHDFYENYFEIGGVPEDDEVQTEA